MTQPTPSLAEFLLARIAEDAAVARAASPGWTGPEAMGVIEGTSSVFVDPRRVLAECDAKLRVVGLREGLARAIDSADTSGIGWVGVEASKLALQWLDDALKALAKPYADHPDFDPVWAV